MVSLPYSGTPTVARRVQFPPLDLSGFFENVRVPKANLVGGLNQGWGIAKALLGFERIFPRLVPCRGLSTGIAPAYSAPTFSASRGRRVLFFRVCITGRFAAFAAKTSPQETRE